MRLPAVLNPVDSTLARWSFLVLVGLGIAATVAIHVARLPTGARGYYNRGVTDTREGRYQGAIANLDRALALKPAWPEAHTARANALYRAGRPYLALADADAALSLAPGSAHAFYVRGLILRRIGRDDDALDSFVRACGADRSFGRAALARADALFDRGDVAGALTEYRVACSLRRTDATLYFAPMLVWASRVLAGDGAGAQDELRELFRRFLADRKRLAPWVESTGDPPSRSGGAEPGDATSAWIDGVKLIAAGDRASAMAQFRRSAAAAQADSWVHDRAWALLETLTLGLRVQPDDPEISPSLSFGPGVTIACVRDRSAAAGAGLLPGDRLVRLDGAAATPGSVDACVARAAFGSAVRLDLTRRGEPMTP